ncbi:hypothetical protein [Streptacidiphilus anmyonensis]|uniref:hypothetical protein n=1 Tax=Streptacidiphilus anmyonensis TaxID=405782 RepID=UPI0005A79E1E|nr:hypothetical protein [Streptacidiphilus anmyonensis]
MAEIRVRISADQAKDTESVVRLLRAHYTDPKAERSVDGDGTVLLVLDTERKAPQREFVADSWTGPDGAVYTVARDKTSPPLTAGQKAEIESLELTDPA